MRSRATSATTTASALTVRSIISHRIGHYPVKADWQRLKDAARSYGLPVTGAVASEARIRGAAHLIAGDPEVERLIRLRLTVDRATDAAISCLIVALRHPGLIDNRKGRPGARTACPLPWILNRDVTHANPDVAPPATGLRLYNVTPNASMEPARVWASSRHCAKIALHGDYDRDTLKGATVTVAPHGDVNVRAASVDDPGTRVERLDTVAADEDPDVRAAVASCETTPGRILVKLATDSDERVRRQVAMHPNTPRTVLDALTRDRRPRVRRAAQETIAFRGGFMRVDAAHHVPGDERHIDEIRAIQKRFGDTTDVNSERCRG